MSEMTTERVSDMVKLPRAPLYALGMPGVVREAINRARKLLPGLLGFGILLVIWQALSLVAKGDLPAPLATLKVFWELLTNPFYDNGPNDKGIGIQLATSLGRVFGGWTIGAAIAIPTGLLIGASPRAMRTLNPLIQIFRPVSPLAWYPIGLAVLKSAPTAVVFAIIITSLWPTLINTAAGVATLPEDLKAVSQVFRFSRRQYLTRVLLPAALPSILTGLRLSMGIAWMVIVAGEMLSGGTGIGFFVWDSWNALSLERVISAILFIGVTGLLLDRGFDLIMRRATAWNNGGA